MNLVGVSKGVIKEVVESLPSKWKLSEAKKSNKVEKFEPFIRKVAHFSLYTLVGLFSMVFFCTYNINFKFRIIWSTLAGFLYAISDEIHQSFVPGRGPLISDVFIDTFRNYIWGFYYNYSVINM